MRKRPSTHTTTDDEGKADLKGDNNNEILTKKKGSSLRLSNLTQDCMKRVNEEYGGSDDDNGSGGRKGIT